MTAPRLVADRTKYIALALRIPQLAQTDLAGPRRMACERTYNTAGPGLMLRTASVVTNKSQSCQVIEPIVSRRSLVVSRRRNRKSSGYRTNLTRCDSDIYFNGASRQGNANAHSLPSNCHENRRARGEVYQLLRRGTRSAFLRREP